MPPPLESSGRKAILGIVGLHTTVLVLLLGLPGLAWASGFYLSGRGASALSRGGAYTVGGRDLNSSSHNPALIGGRGQGWQLYADLGFIHQSVTFRRSLDAESAALYPDCCDEVRNEALPTPDPSIFAVYRLPEHGLALGFAAYGPYAVMPRYPADGPQRYVLVSMRGLLFNYQMTVAAEPIEGLRLGVGFQLREFALQHRMVVSAYPGFMASPEEPAMDTLLELDVADHLNPGALLGLWYRINPCWEVGLSYQTPMDVEAEGDVRVQIASHYLFKTTQISGSRVRMETSLPQVLSAGVRYVAGERWDLELDVVWEDWSVHQRVKVSPLESIRFTDVPGLGTYHVRAFEVEEGFVDTFSARLGGSASLSPFGLEAWKASAGAFYETSAIPDETLTVNVVDSEKLGVGLGVTVELQEGVVLDLAYGHVFMSDRVVTNSRRRQVNTLYMESSESAGEGRTVVGNGAYSSSFDTLALAISVDL